MTILTSYRPPGTNINAVDVFDLFNADVDVLIRHACCAAFAVFAHEAGERARVDLVALSSHRQLSQ